MKYLKAISLIAFLLLVSCSKDEEKPKPVEVSGEFTAALEVDDDFVADKITYGPDDGTQQILAIETSTNRAIKFYIWGETLVPGTTEIDNSDISQEMSGYYYKDVDVLLSRGTALSGTFTLEKLDKDSLVAEFDFYTVINGADEYLTEGKIKLKLR